MRLLKTLFYNCYHFQIKVGNGDMPVFMSFAMILYGLYTYFFAFTMLVTWFIPIINSSLTNFIAIILTIGVGGIAYRNLIWKKQYKNFIESKDCCSFKNKILTVVFFCGAFLLLTGAYAIKCIMNNNASSG